MGDDKCSINERSKNNYTLVRIKSEYEVDGQRKSYEKLADVNGDGASDYGIPMETSVSWEGAGCSTFIEQSDGYSPAEKKLMQQALRAGQSSTILTRSYLVRLSGTTSSDTDLIPGTPLLRYDSTKGSTPVSLPIRTPAGEVVTIADKVTIDLVAAFKTDDLMISTETSIITMEPAEGDFVSFQSQEGHSTKTADAETFLSIFKLASQDTKVFRVVNLVPGHIENGTVRPETSVLIVLPDGVETMPTVSREEKLPSGGTRTTVTRYRLEMGAGSKHYKVD